MTQRNKKYLVRVEPRARKALESLPDRDYGRVATRIAILAVEPLAGKSLHGEYEGFRSLRVWPYRIIYTIVDFELVVIIVRIAHRKDSYR